MNKVENTESFTQDSKPLEMLSEEEKNTPSEMYPDKNSAGSGEESPEKTSSEEKPEPKEEETPEEEQKPISEESQPKEQEDEGEVPESTPKASDDTEEERELSGLKAQEDKLKEQILENIVSLRAQRRQMSEQEAPSSQPTDDDQEDMDPEVKKQLDSYLQKKGIAPETQIREKMQQETLVQGMNNTDKEFFGKYPEYLYSPELRNEFSEIVDAVPSNSLEEYKKRLDIAHNIVKQNHPDRFPSSGGTDTAKKQEALKKASMGAGSQSAPSPAQSRLDPAKVERAKRFYKGFSDEEIEDMLKE